MAKGNFTSDRVDGFQCTPGRQQSIFWDAKTPGLGLRVTAGGAKSFIFESRLNGKTLRVTIGDRKTYSIKSAQAACTALKALTDKGIDPRQVKRDEAARVLAEKERLSAVRIESDRRQVTVKEAWTEYVASQKSSWGRHHLRDHQKAVAKGGDAKRRGKGLTVSGVLYPLMGFRLHDLNSNAVEQWLKSQAKHRPTSTALGYRLLKAFIRWTESNPSYSGLVSQATYSAASVRKSVPKGNAHQDVIQREQLNAWFSAVQRIPNVVISTYLQALLLTGARREEMAELRWEDVDFQWSSLTIRDKVKGKRTIPLPPYLSGLFASLPRRNKWVFSSTTSKSGRLTEPRQRHVDALSAAGLPHVSLHGLRRSFSNLSEWVEMPTGISAQIMGHSPSAIAEKHYKARPLDLLRKWHFKLVEWILSEAGVAFDASMAKPGLRAIA